MNFTIQVPPDTKNHGDPTLLCVPPQWTDYFIFFATNYVAHAATLISRPGEGTVETLFDALNALFIPGSGALRAFRLLVLYIGRLFAGNWRVNSIEEAQRAGALCMVMREEDLGARGHEGFNLFFGSSVEEIPPTREIYGIHVLPRPGPGIDTYRIIEVSANIPLMDYQPREVGEEESTYSSYTPEPEAAPRMMKLPKSRNIPKILISILQVIWGVITLYKAKGNQISLYGYGAFGLTVAPYSIMSLLNLATNLLRPEYSTMYMVHTTAMDEAMSQGGDFRGIVASINEDAIKAGLHTGVVPPNVFFGINMAGYIAICIVLPLALVGGLTGFRPGENVVIATSWILAWLIIGSASALWVRLVMNFEIPLIWKAIFIFPLWIPAIGGFVVVAQMLTDFGICTDFGL
ncbi:hypothetical protein CONLIGDRAFT_677656 [Coniochaeta ligniaria NRRL 30616]|uniref:Uncharacterized protein n=1 Tax=Coniochaeta ligniaria NRRL 30616 TaxID=1408157 RepID=A0A1J7JKL1_9PEZI|nr:hypothetical protein CONLIGDRAFT_677656 [Coniochaeta ligniaria NRRL 30616]